MSQSALGDHDGGAKLDDEATTLTLPDRDALSAQVDRVFEAVDRAVARVDDNRLQCPRSSISSTLRLRRNQP